MSTGTAEPNADAVSARIVLIEPEKLEPHPMNPRPGLTEADVADLIEGIGGQGQHQPCLVRPIETDSAVEFQIVIGHRRVLACRALDRAVECVVQDMDDDEAMAVMLSDNIQRTDPDPLLEAAAVRAFLSRPGWDVRQTAAVLSKSIGWVAGRSVLAKLEPDVATELRKRDWGIGALEEYARLDPAVQREFLDRTNFVRDRQHLRNILGEGLHKLSLAPWDLNDGELVPAAGPCATCPKTSLSAPGLFEDEDVENADVSKATCRDGGCWLSKNAALQGRAAAAILEKEPDLILIDAVGHHGTDRARAYPWAGERPIHSMHDFRIERKPFPGGIKAVELTKDAGAVLVWAKVHPWAAAAKKDLPAAAKGGRKAAEKKAPAVSGAEKMKKSEESVRSRRRAVVVDLVSHAIGKFKGPVGDAAAHAFAGAYTLSDPFIDNYPGAKRIPKLDLWAKNPKAWAESIWPRAKESVLHSLARNVPSCLDGQYAEALHVMKVLEMDVAPFEAEAKKAIPDPKWWAGAEKKATPAAKILKAATARAAAEKKGAPGKVSKKKEKRAK